MKTKKINWQSVLLGMALCMVLVVFVGSKITPLQTSGQDGTIRPVTTADLQLKFIEMQKQVIAMDKNLDRIEKKIDALAEELHQVLKIVRVMDKEMIKK